MQTADNYEEMKNRMALSFLRYDQAALIRKYALDADEDYLYLRFVSRGYRLSRRMGQVEGSDDGFQTVLPANYNEAMSIYDVLCYPQTAPRASEKLVSLASLSKIQGGSLSQKGGFFQSAADFFDRDVPALRRACEALGGKALSGGDAAFELALFPFLPVVLRFWQSDEEFPASLQFLLPENVLSFMHYETMMFALSHVADRLTQLIAQN